MINVNQITTQLARMPDQALQQYAQMHKSDPYVLSLALAESNRRKQMRSSSQMSAPEQPKVVDQALAGMGAGLPALPANNLRGMEQSMAAGGIVAFDEGGEVPRFQSQGLVDERLYRSQDGQYFARPLTGKTGYEGMGPSEFLKSLYEDVKRKIGPGLSPPEKAKAERAAQAQANKLAAVQGSTYEELYGAPTAPTTTDPRARGIRTDAMPPGSAVSEPSAMPKGAAGTGLQTQRSSEPGLKLPQQQTGIAGLSSTPSTLRAEMDMFMPEGPVQDRFAADVKAQGEADVEAARRYRDTRQAQIEGMGALGADIESRLKARQEKLGTREKDLGLMSLVQAGFAMMSGASPYALQNIGVGAQAGLKTYSEGIERLDATREKIDEAFSRLEIARRSEKMLSDKEMAEINRDVDKTVSGAKREAIASARQAYGLDRQEAAKLFEAYTAEKRLGAELGSRERMGIMQMQTQRDVAAAGRPENLYSLLGSAQPGSPLLKGFEMAKEQDKIPRLYSEYTKLSSDPINGASFAQKFPTFEAFLAGMGAGRGGFVQPPANAPVLRPPGAR